MKHFELDKESKKIANFWLGGLVLEGHLEIRQRSERDWQLRVNLDEHTDVLKDYVPTEFQEMYKWPDNDTLTGGSWWPGGATFQISGL